MADLLWVVKTADSRSLSHSKGRERIKILQHAQRRSRQQSGWRHRHLDPIDRQLRSYSELEKPKDRVCPSLAFDFVWSDAERRSVAVFEQTAIHKIITLQRTLPFWMGTVPYLTRTQSAFRHIIVAIAATYELVFHDDSQALNIFALEQCNKATEALMSWKGIGRSHVMISCILIAAYNLLRSDLDEADRSIESGLRVAKMAFDSTKSPTNIPADEEEETLIAMLTGLGRQYGYKLWAPDVSFQFDKTTAGREPFYIDVIYVKGPYASHEDILQVFKTLVVSLVARLMRNLARGAHILSTNRFARDGLCEFRKAFYYTDQLFDHCQSEDLEARIQIVQLKIGLHSIYINYLTKVLDGDELVYDAHYQRYSRMVRLAQTVLDAQKDGIPAIYLDRVVNGSIFTVALCCRDPIVRREAAKLLKDQLKSPTGLKNYLLGTIADTVMEIEEGSLSIRSPPDVPLERRIHLVGLSCRQTDKAIGVTYMMATAPDRSHPQTEWRSCPEAISAKSAQEINETLTGVQVAYSMYMKADQSHAPHGCIRPMYYRNQLVPVCWRPERKPS